MNLGRYELLELIGKGGMGTVYRSRHPDTRMPLAIKILSAEMASQPLLLKRFEQECVAAMRLRHPNIVQGLDFGLADGRPFLVMEYIDGDNLAQRVATRGRLTEPQVICLGTEIGGALEAAHRANLIHRDIKPENILLTRESQAKLADLGLVKDLEAGELTRSGAWLGTVSYMSPEQYGDAKNVDPRSDVYGLAATLYFAVTGQNPFPQKGSLTVLGKKLANDFTPPCRLAPGLSPHVSATISRGLNADRERRQESCAAVVRELVTALTVRPGRQEGRGEGAPEDPDRRIDRRFPTLVTALCGAIGGGLQRWAGKIHDVSLSGMRILLRRRFEPAAVLEVRVCTTGQDATFLTRVCWVRETGSSLWAHGCVFARPITESDLEVFLKGVEPTINLRPQGGGVS